MFFSLQAQAGRCQDRADTVALPPASRRYLLELLSIPDGVGGAPPLGTVWELPLDDLFTLELPAYRTTEGLEGYRFAFTITRIRSIRTISAWGVLVMMLWALTVGTLVFMRPRIAPDLRGD